MIFQKDLGSPNVASLVERKTRYAVLFRNNDRSSKMLMNRLINLLSLSWRELESGMGTEAWFCDPSVPGQKGSVENLNNRPGDTCRVTPRWRRSRIAQ